MSEWEPATDAEVAMRDALRTDDQESYFRILSGVDLLLPVSADALAGLAPLGWGTWSTGGRTHVLAFTSSAALQACLADYTGSARRVPYAELANTWPNLEWWLAVNPGLPIEGYLPAWFVAQLSRGDLRLPTRGPGREKAPSPARIQDMHSAALAANEAAQHNEPGGPTPEPATAAPAAPSQSGLPQRTAGASGVTSAGLTAPNSAPPASSNPAAGYPQPISAPPTGYPQPNSAPPAGHPRPNGAAPAGYPQPASAAPAGYAQAPAGYPQPTSAAPAGYPQPTSAAPAGYAQPSSPPPAGFGQPSSVPPAGFGQPSSAPPAGFGQPSSAPPAGFGQTGSAPPAGYPQPVSASPAEYPQPSSAPPVVAPAPGGGSSSGLSLGGPPGYAQAAAANQMPPYFPAADEEPAAQSASDSQAAPAADSPAPQFEQSATSPAPQFGQQATSPAPQFGQQAPSPAPQFGQSAPQFGQSGNPAAPQSEQPAAARFGPAEVSPGSQFGPGADSRFAPPGAPPAAARFGPQPGAETAAFGSQAQGFGAQPTAPAQPSEKPQIGPGGLPVRTPGGVMPSGLPSRTPTSSPVSAPPVPSSPSAVPTAYHPPSIPPDQPAASGGWPGSRLGEATRGQQDARGAADPRGQQDARGLSDTASRLGARGAFPGEQDQRGGSAGAQDQRGGFAGAQDQRGGFAGAQDQRGGFAGAQDQRGGFAGAQDQRGGFAGAQDQRGGFPDARDQRGGLPERDQRGGLPERDPRGPQQDPAGPLPVRTPMANTPPVPEHISVRPQEEPPLDARWAGAATPAPALPELPRRQPSADQGAGGFPQGPASPQAAAAQRSDQRPGLDQRPGMGDQRSGLDQRPGMGDQRPGMGDQRPGGDQRSGMGDQRGLAEQPAPGFGTPLPRRQAGGGQAGEPAPMTSFPAFKTPAERAATAAAQSSAPAAKAPPVIPGAPGSDRPARFAAGDQPPLEVRGAMPVPPAGRPVMSGAMPAQVPSAEPFLPANDVERDLYDAAEAGSTDRFLSTLLLATVLVPVANHSRPGSAPGESGFAFRTEDIDGEQFLIVFTSKDRLAGHFAEPTRTVSVRFYELIRNWPDPAWSFAVNPRTPVGARYPGPQVIALASWAAEAGLGSDGEHDEQAVPIPAPAPANDDAQHATVMQKTIPAEQVDYYLDRGYDRVAGFVHRATEVEHLRTPGELFGALGLTYDGSPYQPDAKEAYVLRWPAYRPSLYRIPYGGQNEQALKAMDGWVIERPPFRGNGFAPGEGRDVIAEFKVDSVRLPHGAQLWRIDADGSEHMIAIFDNDGPQWRRVGEQ